MNSNNQEKQNIPENLAKGSKTINLIPTMTKEEVLVVETKSKLNVGAAISLFILILLTLGIVGFNIFSKISLNNKKTLLNNTETELKLRDNLISSNDEILRRISLFKKVEATTYSSKEIIQYFQTISNGVAVIDNYEITNGTMFEISGSSADLKEVSKFWYLLGNDKYIESVNLKTVIKDVGSARFTFEGTLKLDEFKKKLEGNG